MRILFLLLLLPLLTQSQNPIVVQEILTVIDTLTGDTAFYLVNKSATLLGDKAKRDEFLFNTAVADVANTHSEAAGLEMNLLLAEQRAKNIYRQADSLAFALTGVKLEPLLNQRLLPFWEGDYRLVYNGTDQSLTLSLNANGMARLRTKDNSVTINVDLLSPTRMRIKNLTIGGKKVDALIGFKGQIVFEKKEAQDYYSDYSNTVRLIRKNVPAEPGQRANK